MARTPIALFVLLFLAACGGASGGDDPGAAADATLVALRVSSTDLVPAFAGTVSDYTATVGFFTSAVRVEPTAADAGATIEVDGHPVASGALSGAIEIPVGATSVEVRVTAADGVTTNAYTATITRAAFAAQDAYVKASNPDANDFFGDAVAISGNTLVVGAPREASSATGVNGLQGDNSAGSSGAAYVFVRAGGVWQQQAYLKPSNTGVGDQFGASVAMSGDTIVVGAPHEDSADAGVGADASDDSAPSAGAAYVFVRNGSSWTQQAYLKASNPDQDDAFGSSVGVFGDTIVVGAPQEDSDATGIDGNQADNGSGESGAAYVFTRSGTAWSQQAYLKASFPDTDDRFGARVAVTQETIVVGAPQESGSDPQDPSDNGFPDSGAAYVFVRSGSTWTEEAYLKASNAWDFDRFGDAVAISGDTIVVGAEFEDSDADGIGGDEDDDTASGAGAAYVFVRSGTAWTQQAYLKGLHSDGGDQFGRSVAIAGNTIVVGAVGEGSNATGINGDASDNSLTAAGAAYVFTRSGTTWSGAAYVKASNTDGGDTFGQRVAISGGTVVVGARGEQSASAGINGNEADNSSGDAGAVYVMR